MSLGLALAGGGLKGVAHIGALKALQELGIKIDYISGTSSGSIFAAMYAMGFSIQEMRDETLAHYKMLTKVTKKPFAIAAVSLATKGVAEIGGLMPSENISELIKTISRDKKMKLMSDVKTPLAITTVDTISTKECIFLSEKCNKKYEDIDYLYNTPIDIAVRSSMSFPGIYTTTNYGKYNFIDGGTKDNLPIQVLKDMGATKTLGLSFKFDPYKPKDDLMAILLRTVDIFSMKDVQEAQKQADLFYEIDALGSSLLEIDDIDRIIKSGYDTIMKNKKHILELMKE